MAATVRVGTCSFADEALVGHWYPPSVLARDRLVYYAQRFTTVEVDSTFYRLPDEHIVSRWAERTPPGFVMHIKAFGVMTRHPVPASRLPPDLRAEFAVDERGRVERPSPEARALVFAAFTRALEPLRAAGKLGGILFQLPPYLVAAPAAFAYLEWARELIPDEMLVEFRHRSWFSEDRREQVLGFLEARGMSYVTVDAPRLDSASVPLTLVAATTPTAYLRFHGRNAATWNLRTGGAARRFDHLYSREELAEWVEPLRRLAGQSDSAFALFNTNNTTDGVAQGPAGALTLRGLLAEAGVPAA